MFKHLHTSIALCAICMATHAYGSKQPKKPKKNSACPRYSSPNVEIEDPSYKYIDRIVGAGLIAPPHMSQRPWSRREFARLILEAKARWSEIEYRSYSVNLNNIMTKLERTFKNEIAAIEGRCSESYQTDNLFIPKSVNVEYLYNHSKPRDVANQDYYLDHDGEQPIEFPGIDASYDPLTENRGGRRTVVGHQLAAETVQSQVFGNYFSVFARPRFATYLPDEQDAMAKVDAQKAYMKFAYRNVELQAGRDELIWGQGEQGGFLFTNHARPLSIVKLSSQSPFRVPLLSYLTGPIKATYFHGTLGERRVLSRAIFYGAYLSFMPAKWIELGAGQALIFGSTPGNEATNGDYISEFMLKRQNTEGGKGKDVADRNNAGSFRIYMPYLRNSQFYGEVLLNVGRDSIVYTLKKLGSYALGLYLPLLGDRGLYDLRFDYVKTNADAYRHARFTEGYTYNRKVMGFPGGPQSERYRIKLRREVSETYELETTLGHDVNYGDRFVFPTKDGYLGDMYIIDSGETETRWMIDTRHVFALNEADSVDAKIGLERVYHFEFKPRGPRDNLLLGLGYKRTF